MGNKHVWNMCGNVMGNREGDDSLTKTRDGWKQFVPVLKATEPEIGMWTMTNISAFLKTRMWLFNG